MRSRNLSLLTLAAIMAVPALTAHATVVAVLTNPTVVTGANAIDPSGSQSIDAAAMVTGANVLTPAATLTARADFQSIQTFTGNGGSILAQPNGIGTADTEVIYFTNAAMPSIQISASGNVGGAIGADIYYDQRVTSGRSAIELQGASTAAFSLTLSFGSYNPTTSTFTGGANSVAATGFTVSNVASGVTISVEYKDAGGNTLNTQTVTGATDNGTGGDPITGSSSGADYYFGYQTPDNSHTISSVTVTVTGAGVSLGLDDLGFTTAPVPEPASLGMLGVAGASLLMSRRIRRR